MYEQIQRNTDCVSPCIDPAVHHSSSSEDVMLWIVVQQILSLQQQVSRLEQEREHWMLETQLRQMKYEKESQVVQRSHGQWIGIAGNRLELQVMS